MSSLSLKSLLNRRTFAFAAGLWIAAFGVAMIVKSHLGVSPIMSLPFVVSQILPLTFGTCVAIEQILFVGAQKLLLKDKFPLSSLFQLPTAVAFGFFCDASLWLIGSHAPDPYMAKAGFLMTGIIILAIGVSIQFCANVMVCASEGVMITIAQVIHSKYSRVKVACDLVSVTCSVLLCLAFLPGIVGLREGTLVSALCVGTFIGIFVKVVAPLMSAAGVNGRSEENAKTMC